MAEKADVVLIGVPKKHIIDGLSVPFNSNTYPHLTWLSCVLLNNVDVNCMVEGRSTIVYLVKEGENVKKGDLLVEIDSSTLRQTLQTATLEVKQAESDCEFQEMLAIQQNQNAADLEAAQVAFELAKLALQQSDGTYPQELADAETLVKMTEITVRNKEEDLEQTKALFAKGFVTAADVKQAELSVTTSTTTCARRKPA